MKSAPLHSAIIFDWSGTIVDDLPPVLEATNAVLTHFGKAGFTREQFRRRFKLPYTRFYEEELPDVPLAELEVVFRRAFAGSTAPVTLLPHAREFLEFAKAANRRLFVLSSAPQAAVEAQAHRLGIHQFFEHFHAGIIDKSTHIGAMLERHTLNPTETCLVGDMVHDIETARAGGITSIAVLTGYDFPEVLHAAAPDLVMPDLRHLREWMRAAVR